MTEAAASGTILAVHLVIGANRRLWSMFWWVNVLSSRVPICPDTAIIGERSR